MEQTYPAFVLESPPIGPEPLLWRMTVHLLCASDGMWLAAWLTHSSLRVMLPIWALGVGIFGLVAWLFERSNP